VTTRVLLCMCLLVLAWGATVAAQDTPVNTTIPYNSEVSDTITETAFFDRWIVDARAGEIIYAEMTARDGLIPFIALLSVGGTILAATPEDATANSTIVLEFPVINPGQYVLLTTRVGVQEGTTSGSYLLTLRNAGQQTEVVTDTSYSEVSFACQGVEHTHALTVILQEDPEDIQTDAGYRVTVYGFDGLVPSVRTLITPTGMETVADCSRDATGSEGDVVELDDQTRLAVPAPDQAPNVARITIFANANIGMIPISVGALEGTTGRYLLLIEGLKVGRVGDEDRLAVEVGPRTQSEVLRAYMLAAPNSRLDPFIGYEEGGVALSCDDLGLRRTCPSISAPPPTLRMNDGFSYQPTRFDAGLVLPTTPRRMILRFQARANATFGGYALAFVGAIPTISAADTPPATATPAP
jgi:hypothetical protein